MILQHFQEHGRLQLLKLGDAMNKLLWILLLTVSILTGCSDPNGPSYYAYGTAWETDGNFVTVISAEIADSSEATEAKQLLQIHCDCSLALGWQIRESTYVSNSSVHYALYDVVVEINSHGEQEYILSFLLDPDCCADGNVDDLCLELEIENRDGSMRRSQGFALCA